MGFYGAAFCDLLLYPAMLLVKKAWDRKENKLHNQKQGSGRLPFALPNKLKAVS
jgi:hypothetical protein